MRLSAKQIMKCVVCVMVLAMLVGFGAPMRVEAASYGGYGYSRLSDNQKALYALLEENVGDLVCPFQLPAEVELNEEDYLAASEALSWDYPQYFYFVPGTYNAIIYPDGVTELTYFTMVNGSINAGVTDNVRSAKSKLDSAVRSIVKAAPSGASAYKKSVYVHDYIVSHVSYAYTSNDQTAYGALCEGKAVCAGYADAYMLLMNKLGVKTRLIEGTANGGAHAWNVSYIDGQCVYTDCTWDDNGGYGGKYAYLNVSGNYMKKTHKADSAFGSLFKSCDHSFPYVEEIKATGIYIGEQSEITMELGKGLIIEPMILPTDATDKTWKLSTDNPDVIKIDGEAFYAIGKGTANVIFTSGDGQASATLSVIVPGEPEDTKPDATEPVVPSVTTPVETTPQATTPPPTTPAETTVPKETTEPKSESEVVAQTTPPPTAPVPSTSKENAKEEVVETTPPTTSEPVTTTENVAPTAPAGTTTPTQPFLGTSDAGETTPAQNATTDATEPGPTTDAHHDVDDEEEKKVSEENKWLCIGVVLLSAIAAAVFVIKVWSD